MATSRVRKETNPHHWVFVPFASSLGKTNLVSDLTALVYSISSFLPWLSGWNSNIWQSFFFLSLSRSLLKHLRVGGETSDRYSPGSCPSSCLFFLNKSTCSCIFCPFQSSYPAFHTCPETKSYFPFFPLPVALLIMPGKYWAHSVFDFFPSLVLFYSLDQTSLHPCFLCSYLTEPALL